jgi:hypothetical protein
MTILNCHHSTRNPLLKSMPKCPNTYQSLDAVALNPGGGHQATAPEGARSRKHSSLTTRQRVSAPYRAIPNEARCQSPNHLSGSSQFPISSSVERRAHAPPVARAWVDQRFRVVVTESCQNKAATGGCVTRLVLRCIQFDSDNATAKANQ